MDATDNTSHRDPAEIEREIRQTQAEMSRTVDRLGDQLTPRNLLNGLLDKADENGIDARYLVDGARRNPIALALIEDPSDEIKKLTLIVVERPTAELRAKLRALAGASPHERIRDLAEERLGAGN